MLRIAIVKLGDEDEVLPCLLERTTLIASRRFAFDKQVWLDPALFGMDVEHLQLRGKLGTPQSFAVIPGSPRPILSMVQCIEQDFSG